MILGRQKMPQLTLRGLRVSGSPEEFCSDGESTCRLEGREPLCYHGELLPLGAYPSGGRCERHLTKQETADGKVLVRVKNEKPDANGVISIIEWVEKK